MTSTVDRRAALVLGVALLANLTLLSTPAHAVNVNCAGLQPALNNSVDGDVFTLTQMCVGAFILRQSTQITLQGAPGAGFNGNAINEPILDGADVENTIIRDLVFSGSTGAVNGGAIHLTGTSAPRIEDNRFFGNSVSGIGGAVYVQQTAPVGPGVVIANNIFGSPAAGDRNFSGQNGGAVYVTSNEGLRVTGNTFEHNDAPNEGGALWFGVPMGEQATISGNRFIDNQTGSTGGAVVADLSGSVLFRNNVFRDNQVLADVSGAGLGGALLVRHTSSTSGSIVQEGNLFANNEVSGGVSPYPGGGGEYIVRTSPATVTSRNDRFIDNSVISHDAWGGGLAIEGSSGADAVEFLATNLVAVANSAVGTNALGGGIYAGVSCVQPCKARLELRNATVLANSVIGAGSTGAQIGGGPEDELLLHNSIVYGSGGGQIQMGSTTARFSDACTAGGAPLPGNGNICKAPKLKDPASGNIHQTATSPTRDKGSNALVPSSLTRDYEGDPRKIDSDANGTKRVDMGADEAKAKPRISIQPSTTDSKLQVRGRLLPVNAGKAVVVSLARKQGGKFVKLASKRVRLSRKSTYSATFQRPAPGTCKATVRFKGSASTSAGSKSKTFAC